MTKFFRKKVQEKKLLMSIEAEKRKQQGDSARRKVEKLLQSARNNRVPSRSPKKRSKD